MIYDWDYTMTGLNDFNQPLTVNIIVNVYLDEEKKNKVYQFTLALPIIEKVEATITHEDGTTETIATEQAIAETKEELINKIEAKIQEQLQASDFLELANRKQKELDLARKLSLI